MKTPSAAFVDVNEQHFAWSLVEIVDWRDCRAREVASGIAVGEFDSVGCRERLESVVGAIRLFRPKCMIGINASWGLATHWVQKFCARRVECTSVFVSELNCELKRPTTEKPYYRLPLTDVNKIASDYKFDGDMEKVALALAYYAQEASARSEAVSSMSRDNYGTLVSPSLIAQNLTKGSKVQQDFNADFAKATATVVIHELLEVPGLIDREVLARAFGSVPAIPSDSAPQADVHSDL